MKRKRFKPWENIRRMFQRKNSTASEHHHHQNLPAPSPPPKGQSSSTSRLSGVFGLAGGSSRSRSTSELLTTEPQPIPARYGINNEKIVIKKYYKLLQKIVETFFFFSFNFSFFFVSSFICVVITSRKYNFIATGGLGRGGGTLVDFNRGHKNGPNEIKEIIIIFSPLVERNCSHLARQQQQKERKK
jgi:hypothetical protein